MEVAPNWPLGELLLRPDTPMGWRGRVLRRLLRRRAPALVKEYFETQKRPA
ncbi:hypothetical protein GCM10022402_10060 [Salinactinospora qingdaonensis]|uniref:Uncharacterized protein n=1 Tax=Salinactinospora qingdaonensis TaxID=702744 RepID=A0ABP7F4I4_9ACTN